MRSFIFLAPVFLFSVFFLAGCGKLVGVLDSKSCSVDSDCACGVSVNTGDCFFGNKDYVNTEKQCPDFCTGVAGHLKVVCSDNKCVQVRIKPQGFCGTSTSGFCSSSDDCVKGGCSSQVCQSKNEESAITTCEYKECYNSDAYNLECKCVDSKCEWGAE